MSEKTRFDEHYSIISHRSQGRIYKGVIDESDISSQFSQSGQCTACWGFRELRVVFLQSWCLSQCSPFELVEVKYFKLDNIWQLNTHVCESTGCEAACTVHSVMWLLLLLQWRGSSKWFTAIARGRPMFRQGKALLHEFFFSCWKNKNKKKKTTFRLILCSILRA